MRKKSTPEHEIPTPEPEIPTPEQFWSWAKNIPVSSRDTGYGPLKPWGTQAHLIDEVLTWAKKGVRQFMVTKAGQVGASTAMQLLTTYWLLHFPGMEGACVANEDNVRDFFRDNLAQMALAAPCSSPTRLNNKSTLALENGSRMLFHTAGPKTGHRLSVGRGFNFFHGTELALWSNPSALTIARTRFSDSHPFRLLVLETTPRGKNWWFDTWDESENAVDIRRVELLWWMREDYCLEETSELFKRYWNGSLTSKERRWAKEIERRYQRTLTPGQWAWRRFYVSEKAGGDERTASQEMATLVEDGFEATGVSFLPYESLRKCRRSVSTAPTPQRFRYEFGSNIEDTKLKPTIPSYESCSIWETPNPVDGYVVAAVPAFSANREDPEHVLSVWRASRDTLIQVAEFGDEECGMQNFAWVCMQMIGTYRAPRKAFILEVAGMGAGVLVEMKRAQASGWGTLRRAQLHEIIGGTHSYLWRRPDTLSAGAALHWRSSPELSLSLMNRLRDQIGSGRVTVRSPAMLEQLDRIRQDGDDFKAEGKSLQTHRVISAALAVESWASQLVPVFQRVQGTSRAQTVSARMAEDFFTRLRQPPKVAGGRR